MSFETHPQYSLNATRLARALYFTGGLSLLLLVYAAVRVEIEPFWLLLAAPVPLVLPVLLRKFPVVLMVAVVYVGSFKSQAAVGISVTDPTLVAVALLYAAVCLKLLLVASGIEGHSLRDLFAGQMLGVIAFFLLMLVVAISYTYTPAPVIGSQKVLKLIGFDTLAFVAPLILLRGERDVSQLVRLSLGLSLVLAGRVVYRVLHPTVTVLTGAEDPTQIGAGLLTAAAVLMVLFFPLATKGIYRALLGVCVAVLTIATVASLSRSAILSLLLVATASLVFLRLDQGSLSRRSILLAVATVIVVVSVSTLWLRRLPATYSKFTVKAAELSAVLGGSPPPGTFGQRYSFAESAWQAFLAKPLLGWGAGGWSTMWHYSDGRVLTHPHNFVLEIAAEQGLAGLTALALLLAAMIGACAEILKASEKRFAFIVPVVMLCLLSNVVTGQLEEKSMWFWWGTLFALARMVRHQQHPCEISA